MSKRKLDDGSSLPGELPPVNDDNLTRKTVVGEGSSSSYHSLFPADDQVITQYLVDPECLSVLLGNTNYNTPPNTTIAELDGPIPHVPTPYPQPALRPVSAPTAPEGIPDENNPSKGKRTRRSDSDRRYREKQKAKKMALEDKVEMLEREKVEREVHIKNLEAKCAEKGQADLTLISALSELKDLMRRQMASLPKQEKYAAAMNAKYEGQEKPLFKTNVYQLVTGRHCSRAAPRQPSKCELYLTKKRWVEEQEARRDITMRQMRQRRQMRQMRQMRQCLAEHEVAFARQKEIIHHQEDHIRHQETLLRQTNEVLSVVWGELQRIRGHLGQIPPGLVASSSRNVPDPRFKETTMPRTDTLFTDDVYRPGSV